MSDYGNISSGAGTFDSFKTDKTLSGTKDFLESNSLVAKVAFLLLVVVVFVIAVRFSAQFLAWLFSFNSSPYLFSGMIDAKTMKIIPQDPTTSGAVTLTR